MIAALTPWVIIAIVVLGIGWTSVAARWGGPGATISEHVTRWSGRYPLIPFGLGLLVGHWLW